MALLKHLLWPGLCEKGYVIWSSQYPIGRWVIEAQDGVWTCPRSPTKLGMASAPLLSSSQSITEDTSSLSALPPQDGCPLP